MRSMCTGGRGHGGPPVILEIFRSRWQLNRFYDNAGLNLEH